MTLVDSMLVISVGVAALGGFIYSLASMINSRFKQPKWQQYKNLKDLRTIHHRSINQEIWEE